MNQKYYKELFSFDQQ